MYPRSPPALDSISAEALPEHTILILEMFWLMETLFLFTDVITYYCSKELYAGNAFSFHQFPVLCH